MAKSISEFWHIRNYVGTMKINGFRKEIIIYWFLQVSGAYFPLKSNENSLGTRLKQKEIESQTLMFFVSHLFLQFHRSSV